MRVQKSTKMSPDTIQDDTGEINRINMYRLRELVHIANDIFDKVMVVDSIEEKEALLGEMRLEEGRRSCRRSCPLSMDKTGCICKDAISTEGTRSKFVVDGKDAYFVLSKPVRYNQRIMNIVMIKKVDTTFSFGTSDVGNAVEKISNISSSLVVDQLTKIYNRKYLEDNNGYWVENAKKTNTEMCLASIDIDNFKRFNDSYGHDFGDKVLRTLAECMEETVKDVHGAYPIRVGGDEFLVISINGMSKKRFMAMMDVLCSMVKNKKLRFEQEAVGITISIGTASVISENCQSYKELYDNADKALYRAKEAGKNCVR